MLNKEEAKYFMALAYYLATQSPDPSSQNGAVLVHRQVDGELKEVAKGFNHFYKGIPPQVGDRDEKLRRIEHAERDVIYHAASNNISTRGAILVCPWQACVDCARAIIGSRIGAIVYHKQRQLLTDRRWLDQFNRALTWIEDAGIQIQGYDGPVPGAQPILISGKRWHPGTCKYVGE